MSCRKPIRVGLFLPSYFDPGVSVPAAIEELVARAQFAEDLGFASLFLGHHLLSASQFLQPMSLAAYLAGVTNKIKIGLGVYLLPLSNPLAFAEEVATVSALAQGRFICGIGAGYREREFIAVGVPFGERFKRIEEYVLVVQRLLSGESVTCTGSFGSLKNATVQLAVNEIARPELWMGAFGDSGIRRCGRIGLPWLAGPEGSIGTLRSRLEIYRDSLQQGGHEIPESVPIVRELLVGESDEIAISMARPYLEKQYATYKSWDHGLTSDDLINSDAVIGAPDTVADRLNQYRDLGFTEVIVRMDWPGMSLGDSKMSLTLLARDVMPRLK